MSIVQYHTEGSNGECEIAFGSEYRKAKTHAKEHGLRVIESTYVFEDSEMVDDFTPDPECSCCGSTVEEKQHEIDGKLHCADCFEATP